MTMLKNILSFFLTQAQSRLGPYGTMAMILSVSVYLWAGVTGGPPSNAERLTLQGSQMIGPNGSPVILRGFNWGAWGTPQQQDAADNKAQGANVVRLPLRWWGVYSSPDIDSRSDSSPGHIDPDHLKKLDQEIQWITSQGLWVVLMMDSDCGQNGTQDAEMQKYCDPQNQYASTGHNFWSDPSVRQKYKEAWQFLAERYRNQPLIAMYEILPEPNPNQASQEQVTEFYKEIINAITPIDNRTPFLIGASPKYNINSAGDAFLPEPVYANKIVYTGNLFVHTGQDQATNIKNLSKRLQGLTDLRDQKQVPIFIQQTGSKSGEDPDMTYLNAVLSLLNQNQVPWTLWQYRDHASANGYGMYYPERNGQWVLKKDRLEVVKKYFTSPAR
jgi:hypothetical protein